MSYHAAFAAAAALTLPAMNCGEPRPIQHREAIANVEGENALSNGSVTAPAAGPDGEIIPDLGIPTAVIGTSSLAADAGPKELHAELRRALAENRTRDAAAVADVLLVLDPLDDKALELRARSLELQGDVAGATADRKRCCELGRSACCL